MQPRLADLDELLLSVRDRNSRIYAAEALAAYRAGAFRAAVVATWIATSYDILSKVRELASQGNAEAETLRVEFDAAVEKHEAGDGAGLKKLQEIERGLLATAASFEFLSASERAEMDRLFEDRHRCAHPAFTSGTVLFAPSGELVRLHLVNIIRFLLRFPPV